MKVLVSASARFAIAPNGTLWTPNASLRYAFWTRYLEVFDGARLVVRAKPEHEIPHDWVQADGPGIEVVALPHFVGPIQFARHLRKVRSILNAALTHQDATMLRLPCVVGNELWRQLEPGRPYGVEIVGDPQDVFAAGAVRHPLSPFLHWWWPRTLRAQCGDATAATYVTEHTLQRRYPASINAFRTHYSSVDLHSDAFVEHPRDYAQRPAFSSKKPMQIITVGSLDQLYKAPDVLIDAIAHGVNSGLNLELTLVGEGVFLEQLKAQTNRLGLQNRIRFTGQISALDVRRQLDLSDLFVLPSRTEGLPRAMIEAMARALPCIGSSIGGIPELLAEDDLVEAGNYLTLAHKIAQLYRQPQMLTRMSGRNFERAHYYQADILRERRTTLYRHVRARTEEWLNTSYTARRA